MIPLKTYDRNAIVSSYATLGRAGNHAPAQVDLLLIERLLRYVCGVVPYSGGAGSNGSEPGAVKGAVLVFLPVRHLSC